MNKVILTIEARMGSTRLPGKVLKKINGRPMLSLIIERLKQSKKIDQIIVATTELEQDDCIQELAVNENVSYFRGSETDILKRLSDTCQNFDGKTIVSLTGDNPFVDGRLVDDALEFYFDSDLDYTGTTHMQHSENWNEDRFFPRGVTLQITECRYLISESKAEKNPEVRSLGLFCIYDKVEKYKIKGFPAQGEYEKWISPETRMTVDTPEDFNFATKVFNALGDSFRVNEALDFLEKNPDIAAINSKIVQKVGYKNLIN